MHLKEHMKSLSKAEKEDLAKRCGTSVAQLKQVAGQFRPCREALAILIERETGGAVTCEELCPAVDWAYLRNSTHVAEREKSSRVPTRRASA